MDERNKDAFTDFPGKVSFLRAFYLSLEYTIMFRV